MHLILSSSAKTPKHQSAVSCEAKNCAYHDGDHYCTADRIKIGPSYARAKTDTVCITFTPREFG